MEAVAPLSPYNKQIKAHRNRHRRTVHLPSGIYAPTATGNDYPKQPPLLPLPFVVPKASPTKKKHHNLTRHQSLITKSPPSKSSQQPDETRLMGSANPSVDKFFAGESVFMMAPPPSSLPLPRFSVRPKRSCTVEAAGVDAGATDGLRRILRLP